MVAEEDRGGARDLGERGLRVPQQQLEVLRRQLVGESQRLVEVASDDRRAPRRQRLRRDAIGWAESSRSTASTVRCASEASGVTSTARASGSCSPWATRSAATCRGSALGVRDDRHLARAGERVDAHFPGKLSLGLVT